MRLDVQLLRDSFALVVQREPELKAPRNARYAWGGAALLETVREVGGQERTPRANAASSDAYAAIAGLMQAGNTSN